MFTKAELHLLDEMLDYASNEMSNAGCNDFELEDTPENREIVTKAEQAMMGDDFEGVSIYKGKILTNDNLLVDYLRDRIKWTLTNYSRS